MLVGSLLPEPKQDAASSTTSFDFEPLVSVVGFTQIFWEEKVIELGAPLFPTQRSVSFWGLSFWPLQTSHAFLIWQHKLPPH